MVAIFARPDNAWMLVECKRDVSFERQARAFQNDLGAKCTIVLAECRPGESRLDRNSMIE